MNIIGIAGTNGSGKDTIGQILKEDHGYLFVSVTDVLRAELKKDNQSLERENMRTLGDKWRREIGVGVLIDKAIEIYRSKSESCKGLVVSSIRNVGEVDYIHKKDGIVIWVDADAKIRYQRITSRQRGSEDEKTYEEFLKEEQEEMQSSGDEATLSMSEVKKLCDVFIENNSDDKKILKSSIADALREYL